MPTPRERLLLIFEAEHPETADRAVKDEAIRRTFGMDPAQYRALIAELQRRESHADAA
ncbi:DUF3263 domain-containing protein [Leifsonia poae]|uniref:DUF3263 domain-containing protein n=1 Tax=Leifsonia poae TaxID=110933 RepID=A0A9W6LYS3_9MICO|nr:DUF3263 domain-containing protein [Leifsonia poae]GLJ74894.1 hypothetical protein GCM10017584_04670 [Leifsonia poae]